jgi:hypothetical protein
VETISKEIHRLIAQKEKKLDIIKTFSVNWELFRLDMKSFFIFTQIFLDTLARIIRLTYGKKGEQLPYNMTDLLKSRKAMELDEEFFENLREKMIWYSDFNDKRDDIVHWLGSIRSTTTRQGDMGFDILKFDIHAKEMKKEQRSSWGTKTVLSAMVYIQETINNLSVTISYIHERSKQLTNNHKP